MNTIETYKGIEIYEEFSDRGNGDNAGFYYWCDISPYSYKTLEEIKDAIDIRIVIKKRGLKGWINTIMELYF